MRDREAFQEVDYRAAFGPLAKWAVEIDDADRVARARRPRLRGGADRPARAGGGGAARGHADGDDRRPRPGRRSRIPVAARRPPSDMAEIARRLDAAPSAAGRWSGGGGWGAAGRAGLRAFAEANRLPVLVGFRDQDCLDNASPSYAGDAGLGKTPARRGR